MSQMTLIADLPSPKETPEFDYLYWIGCAGSYDSRIKSIVKATVTILNAAGLNVAALGEGEACCGDPARRLGEEGLFQQLALRNVETLNRYKVRRILTHCAHCFSTLKNEYPRFGGNFEVIHHSELLAELIRNKRLKFRPGFKQKMTLHDSCYLGRYNGVFDAPRDALRALPNTQLTEMPRTREWSFCCGAGGGNFWHDAPKRIPAGVIRLREASSTGAGVVVAECPFCVKLLEQAGQVTPDAGLQVKDIAEVVAGLLDPEALTSISPGRSNDLGG